MEKENVLLLILIILLFVLYYFSGCKSENFADLENKKDNCVVLMVFLTKHCPHCKTYDNHQHEDLENKLANHNIKIKKVYADEDDDNLFDKHEVMFVPAGVVMKGDAKAKVNGAITHENVMNTAKNMK